MHILMIPSRYFTKSNPVAGSFFRDQAHVLKRGGHEVGVIKPERSSVPFLRGGIFRWPHCIAVQNDDGVPTYRHRGMTWIPSLPRRKAIHWYLAGRSLFKRYCRDHGPPDIIHAHCSLYAGLLGMWLKREYRIPLVITEHSTDFALKRLSHFELRCAEKAFSAADVKIAVSPQLGNLLAKTFGEAFAAWAYIPNVVDKRFAAFQVPRPRRKASEFRWLNIAYLMKKKGHADLLQAFAKAFAVDKTVSLHIAGDGPLEKELRQLATTLGIAERVNFLGRIDRSRVLEELSAADAFVLSSHYETFGVAVIEATAMGKPVVATACGGPEYILNKTNGILVPPRSVEQLAEAMQTLKTEIARFDAMDIRQDCVQRFGDKAILKELNRIYSESLKK